MKKPLVSAYITNYNYGKYLEKAINSLLQQTYSNIEILIIDDGSKDSSLDILKRVEKESGLKVIFQKNKGLNATNNVAIKRAMGKYLVRLDADDFLHSEAIEKMVLKIEQHPDACMVFPDYYNVDEDGEIINRVKRHNFEDVSLFDQPAHGAVTLIRLDYLRAVGGYDESFRRQDGYDLWLKMSNKYRVLNINEPLFYYRQHGKSITDNEEKLFETRRSIKRAHVSKRGLKPLKVLAIVPIRGHEFDEKSFPLRSLGGKALLDYTIENALSIGEIENVIVTSPSKEVLKHISNKYDEKVIQHKRNIKLAQINQRIDQTLFQALEKYLTDHSKPDLVLLLYIEAPLRSASVIQESIDTLKLFDVDAIEAVRQENGILYQHDGTGLKYLQENHELKLERNDVYKRVGGLHLMRFDKLMEKKRMAFERTGHIILDQKQAHFIQTELDWGIAEYLVNK
mgnify:CR=1 FL=1